MTRQEAKEILKSLTHIDYSVMSVDERILFEQAYDMAIEALSQEPCEDVISREQVLISLDGIKDNYGGLLDVARIVREMPAITPARTKGKWLENEIRGSKLPYCSVCNSGLDVIYHYRYCPNCGAEMEVE